MPETVERDRDIIVGKLQYTEDSAFRGDTEDPTGGMQERRQHSLYVVTDGETAGLHTTVEKTGERLAGLMDAGIDDVAVYTPDERTLDDLDGQAARELDYDLDPLPDDEYQTVLDEAGLDL